MNEQNRALALLVTSFLILSTLGVAAVVHSEETSPQIILVKTDNLQDVNTVSSL